MSKVVAITVTYHPQADVFLPLLNQLLLQTAQVIVVTTHRAAATALWLH